MQLIDTHAHVYLLEFGRDRNETMERAKNAGVAAIFMPAIDASTHKIMMHTAQQFAICKCMMGLHPCSVKEDVEKELSIVKEYLQQQNFIAIGEIGLDFYWDKTFTQQQYHAFH